MAYPALNSQMITQYLHTPELSLEVRPTLTSTNTVLRILAEQGAPAGSVLVAEEQSSGRGRLGRSFFSPAECGIYFTVLLRPDLALKDTQLITTAAAVAVCEAIEQICGQETQIKWVNDVYLNGRKICGILTEGVPTAQGDRLSYALLGIGINIFPSAALPPELCGKAAAVFPARPPIDYRPQLVAAVLDNFFRYYPTLPERGFYQSYKKRLFILNQEVLVTQGSRSFTANVLDLTEDCRLKVQLGDGKITYLDSGEISIKPLS